jgi:hypothetical protein
LEEDEEAEDEAGDDGLLRAWRGWDRDGELVGLEMSASSLISLLPASDVVMTIGWSGDGAGERLMAARGSTASIGDGEADMVMAIVIREDEVRKREESSGGDDGGLWAAAAQLMRIILIVSDGPNQATLDRRRSE